ncbi:MAG: glycoside hydrolase domain-containing protein, partial [Candidatus Fervidibacter sp.]|uniref:glycoside hydrolase domain-containing protein n=1 Tax=Candidatus Fervidibacter sp. TaxID=3100871 RepID=UPI00404B3A9F
GKGVAPVRTTVRVCFSNLVVFGGVANLLTVRNLSAEIIRKEVSRVQSELQKLRSQLPSKPRTAMGRKAVSWLDEQQRRLSASNGLTEIWQLVRTVSRSLLEGSELVMRGKMAEKLQRPYAAFFISPMTKLRPEQLPDIVPTQEIVLHAARGEGESAQLLIAALERHLENVKVSFTPLVGPKGFLVFPKANLVGYVPVQNPTLGGFGVAGRYPDPLLPMTTFDVPQGEHRSVWLTVWVPQDAISGSYEGAVIVEPQNLPPTKLKVQLRVYPVTLPAQSFLKTCVLIWDYKARQVYGDAWTPEKSKRFYELCLRYRFTPPPPLPWGKVFVRQPDGKWTANWDEFDSEVEAWMERGATAFSIAGVLRWGTKPPPENEREEVAAKLRLLGEHLKSKGWSERFYFYVFDEPSTSEFVNIESLCRFVHRHAPELNILLTSGYGATGAYRTHAPTPDGAFYRALANFINIWVPHIDCFDEPFLRERKKTGDQVWMYVCISTVGKTYPDIWRIDWTGTAHRAIGWWLWRYGCDGFLYWCVNYWTDDKGKTFDLFSNPTAYPGGNGEGFLFYPDPQKGEPIPSVRAEIFRDGIEDYDLLTLLKQRNHNSPLLNASDIIFAPNKFADDPQAYERRHQEILKALSR